MRTDGSAGFTNLINRFSSLTPVHLPSVPDANNQHDECLVLDLVDDAVIAYADPIEFRFPLKLFHPSGPRFARERIDRDRDAPPGIFRQFPQIAEGRRLQDHGVWHGLQPQILLDFLPLALGLAD
jgi:hypothetical protein